MATSSDIKTDFIVNTMSRAVFNELCASGEILDDQMYLVDDEVLDAFCRKIVNVEDPETATDAVNVRYLSDYYVEQSQMPTLVDSTKVFDALKSQYIDCGISKYRIDFTEWDISLTATEFTKEDVQIKWNPRTDQGRLNGYNLVIKGYTFETGEYSKDATLIHNVENHAVLGKFEIKCTRSKTAVKIDSYISKKEMYDCLSSVNETTDIAGIRNALTALNSKLSAFDR